MQHTHWHIGCSGFYYHEWKNKFYPRGLPQAKWFEHYCTQFNALELNVTFYRLPKISVLQSWHRRSPDGFTFAVKAPQLVTHRKQFVGAENDLVEFYKTIRFGLKEKMGPVLFQLPAAYAYSEERLEQLLNHLHPEFINVVEFRHGSWWKGLHVETLREHNVIFCGVSYPRLPDAAVVNHSVAYYRFHGVPRLYHSAYEPAFLLQVFRQLNGPTVGGAFAFFNNTASGAAIDNAKYLQALASDPET